ncbi:hypothetical protein CJ030_MR4G014240 [Morella rubra]|uniref:C-type mannose receptor 2 n=1 Tax=Morella rubra TaxID=262757 RepID=A0A6A1VV68_9ROSI|nr:hypothetical protein CJ030_MR4G014240 [Morella rubra]
MRRKQQMWYVPQPLTPLMEWPDPETQEEGNKKERSWEVIREWFIRTPKSSPASNFSGSLDGNMQAKRQDLRLLLGVLGCPLAPIPLASDPVDPPHIKDIPMENSTANYIIQQYLAATGCLKQGKCAKNMYATGMVKMVCCETEVSSGKNVKTLGTRSGENGCFVFWQMSPGNWSLDLVVGGNQVIAGSDGKIVWRHTPWLGTHAAKGPQRPLRRIIQLAWLSSKLSMQGLDPKTTASLFADAQCLGEKRIGHDDCFVLKVSADKATVMERSEGPAEVIRHVFYGYFCQKSGLLVYLEDSHLTRVQTPENETVYWEISIGSSIGDYRDVDGVMIAHRGRSIATVFRFGELSQQHCRTRMEEVWTIDDVVYNVPGLSLDYFIPPADIVDHVHSP